MNRILPLLLSAIVLFSASAWAQQVPSRMEFANMDLRLTAGAIKDIQADVDALTRSEKYFQKKLQRVDMYMPIIERIFREEDLPEDFKYLVIQESALVSDAVSSSNAVGFWQFKEISGLENDLRIDRHIDERMNIVSSSRAAASYLKSHNQYFDNWAYALIAYQRGRGGAADVIDERNFGKTHLKITSDTYWYLKKFLAHKIAFENVLGTSEPPYYLKEVDDVKGTSIKSLAKKENISVELLSEYNKWVKRDKIPEDKGYTVIVPLDNLQKIESVQNQQQEIAHDLPGTIDDNEQHKFPLVDHYPARSDRSIPHKVEINGLAGIYAAAGYSVKMLAETAGIDEYKFRRYNDLKIRETLKPGQIYYLRKKRNRAKFYYHTVETDENMWSISQKYGVKLKKLYRKNRMEALQEPEAGRVLWLRHNRPANIAIEYRTPPTPVKKKENIETVTNRELEIANVEKKDVVKTIEVDSSTISQEVETIEPEISEVIAEDTIHVEREFANDSMVAERPTTELAIEPIEETENAPLTELEEESEFEAEDHDKQELMEYVIKKGDTFFSIANRFNMKISSLLNANNLQIRDTLSINQIIRVNKMDLALSEKKEPENDTPLTSQSNLNSSTLSSDIQHTVLGGETMYSLAKKYNVSLKEIMEWNDKEDFHLKTGELILIKQK